MSPFLIILTGIITGLAIYLHTYLRFRMINAEVIKKE